MPYAIGSPTVVAQETKAVLGASPLGHLGFYIVQLATMLILYTGGNTSFNGFPYLASFVAGDRFLPRQLTRRGHRLAFSNGILVLAAVALALVLVYRAQLNGLVALYAIGVFTGFTMAGLGDGEAPPHGEGTALAAQRGGQRLLRVLVVQRRADLRLRQVPRGGVADRRRRSAALPGSDPHAREYKEEDDALESGVAEASEEPLLRRHVVVVLVDRLDMAAVRALQYARTLTPDDLRAVHFDIDSKETRQLEDDWTHFGLARVPLDIIDCPDRRLLRAAVEPVADATIDGDTECTVLLPRRGYGRGWERFLHDRTADKLAATLSQVPHVSATIIPFNLPGRLSDRVRSYGRSVQEAHLSSAPAGQGGQGEGGRTETSSRTGHDRPGRRDGSRKAKTVLAADQTLAQRAGATTPIAAVTPRQRVRVAGRVKSVRVQPRAGTQNLECVVSDGSGGLLLVFQGRPKIAGIEPGARLVAEGMVGTWGRRPAMLNPSFELVQGAPVDPTEA